MATMAALSGADQALIQRLNRQSVEKTFVPATDLDWSDRTPDADYARLYDAWSLLKGSGRDAQMSATERIDFARYQQANLMLFTALLERYGLGPIERLYDMESDLDLMDYVAHFIKEESYHHQMFMRAVKKLHAEMPTRPALPEKRVALYIRFVFWVFSMLPSRKLRVSCTFLMMHFAEEISVLAHAVAKKHVENPDSFVPRVWALHAIDEGRHLRFDAFIVERYGLKGPLRHLPKLLVAPFAVGASMLLNGNEIWAARRLGVNVRFWHLPGLVKGTTAPFKRRVFSSVQRLFGRADAKASAKKTETDTTRTNTGASTDVASPEATRPGAVRTTGGEMTTLPPGAARIQARRALKGVEGYIWAFKKRAQEHHCVGYGTLKVELDHVVRMRKTFSRQVAPITTLPIYIKAVATALEQNPEANAILFKKLWGYEIVNFENVDVNVPITRRLDGEPFTFLATIRAASQKSLVEIQNEITTMQRTPPEDSFAIQRIRRFQNLPLTLSRLFHESMRRSPKTYLKHAGTCGLTLMEGSFGDHFFPIGPTSAVFSVGGARPEAVVRDGEVVVRRLLHVCLGVDNYVVPGPVGAKLAHDFKTALETVPFLHAELEAHAG